MVERTREFDWHVEFMVQSMAEAIATTAFLSSLNVPYVFDHVAHAEPDHSISTAAKNSQSCWQSLKNEEHAWITLYSFYQLSKSGAPEYADMVEVIQDDHRRAAGPRHLGQQLAASEHKRPNSQRRRSAQFSVSGGARRTCAKTTPERQPGKTVWLVIDQTWKAFGTRTTTSQLHGDIRFYLEIWEFSNPIAGVFDNHNGTALQCIRALGNHVGEALNYKRGSSIPQAEQYDTSLLPFGKRDDFTKVEVKGYDDAGLCHRLFKSATVR